MSVQLQTRPNINLAYAEAAKIDEHINILLEKYPPNLAVNAQFWHIFNRTIQSGLTIIDTVIKEQKHTVKIRL